MRAGMQLIEIRFAVFTAHDGLAIDHDRAHRKGVQRLNDAREAVHPIEAATSVEPYPIVAAPGDQAVSVVLDLVHPLRPALAPVGCGRKARCDEARRQRTRERAARTHTRRLLTWRSPIRPNVGVDHPAAVAEATVGIGDTKTKH